MSGRRVRPGQAPQTHGTRSGPVGHTGCRSLSRLGRLASQARPGPRYRPDVITDDSWSDMVWDRWTDWPASDRRWSTHLIDTTDRSSRTPPIRWSFGWPTSARPCGQATSGCHRAGRIGHYPKEAPSPDPVSQQALDGAQAGTLDVDRPRTSMGLRPTPLPRGRPRYRHPRRRPSARLLGLNITCAARWATHAAAAKRLSRQVEAPPGKADATRLLSRQCGGLPSCSDGPRSGVLPSPRRRSRCRDAPAGAR